MIVEWLRAHHPYWDRSGGRDHVFFLTGDQGACGLGAAALNAIFVVHWGLLGSPSRMAAIASGEYTQSHFRNTSTADFERALQSGRWCYSPAKDVLAAPFITSSQQSVEATDASQASARRLLVHAGGIYGWRKYASSSNDKAWYSLGVRQRLYHIVRQAANSTGALPIESHGVRIASPSGARDYGSLLRSSHFCLAPAGLGWGVRMSEAVLHGCMPLTAQPFVVQPLEEVSSWSAPRIDDIDVIGPTLFARLREWAADEAYAPRRAETIRVLRQALAWDRLAYNYTLLALCHRAVELRGTLKSGSRAGCAQMARALPGASLVRHEPSWFTPALREAIRAIQRDRRRALTESAEPAALDSRQRSPD